MAETIKKGDGSIDPAKLRATLTEYQKLQEEKSAIGEDITEMLNSAAENLNLHKAAFKLAAKLKGKESAERNDFLRAFDSYRHILDLDEQPDMLDNAA